MHRVTSIVLYKLPTYRNVRAMGFTLIELSISLVIIGLIVGGIIGARDLIRQAEIRSISSEFNAYESAVNTFLLKYDAWPGDMLNATSYWTSGTGNGNGNGLVAYNAEMFLAWEHLAFAGIIPGSYTGASVSNEAVIGTNVPPGPLDGSGYCFRQGTVFGNRLKNYIQLGSFTASDCLYHSVLTTADGKSLDEKMDDGVANTGRLLITDGAGVTATDCSHAATHATGTDFNLATTDVVCRAWYSLEK